jgi:hypothetical protein
LVDYIVGDDGSKYGSPLNAIGGTNIMTQIQYVPDGGFGDDCDCDFAQYVKKEYYKGNRRLNNPVWRNDNFNSRTSPYACENGGVCNKSKHEVCLFDQPNSFPNYWPGPDPNNPMIILPEAMTPDKVVIKFATILVCNGKPAHAFGWSTTCTDSFPGSCKTQIHGN